MPPAGPARQGPGTALIEVCGLRATYGRTVAVDSLDLDRAAAVATAYERGILP